MKRFVIAISVLSFFTGCNENTSSATKADTAKNESAGPTAKAADEWIPVDSVTAMKTMMETGTPGAEHAMLAKADGNWVAETTMWMAPGTPPATSKGSAVNKMEMGGRYQKTSFKGNMMGMPFEGGGTTGYDKGKKVFFTTWMDNMSTGIMNMEGKWDEGSKSIEFKGKMLCPANGKECEVREVYKIVDDNTHIMEMYGPDMATGKEFKNMEIKFTRSK